MWKHSTPGIPDELFERVEDVPITKEEVRVIQISNGKIIARTNCIRHWLWKRFNINRSFTPSRIYW